MTDDDDFMDDLPWDQNLAATLNHIESNITRTASAPTPAVDCVAQKRIPSRQKTLDVFVRRATTSAGSLASCRINSPSITTTTSQNRLATVPPTLNSLLKTMPIFSDDFFAREIADHPFNADAIKTWQYPIDRPIRAYQYNIVRNALFSDTLCALPTGLGKTFIASVVILNYIRWFPTQTCVFVLPTRPLVHQQRLEVERVCGFASNTLCCELDGRVNVDTRRKLWRHPEKHVYFVTAETFRNDLEDGSCPIKNIACVVMDEVHHATGNHASLQAVQLLRRGGGMFRLLGLSATPGSDREKVQSIVDDLGFSHLEVRTEGSSDVVDYVHAKEPELIYAPDDPEIAQLRSRICSWLQPVLDDLVKARAIDQIQATKYEIMLGTRFQVFSAQKKFRERSHGARSSFSNAIGGEFHLLSNISHGLDLLRNYGVRAFYENLKTFVEESMSSNGAKKVSKIRQRMMALPEWRESIWSSVVQWCQDPLRSSHPKVSKMKDLIQEHFANHPDPNSTRVIVFAEYREVVHELTHALSNLNSTIKASIFVGQASARSKKNANNDESSKSGKGMAQKKQMEILQKFRSGEFNVLVATCIGEEGLDVGGVDLCICFDSKASVTRNQQRQGRAGRHRPGRVLVLYSHSREISKFHRSEQGYKSVQKAVQQGDVEMPRGINCRVLPVNAAPTAEFVLLARSDSDLSEDDDKNEDKTISERPRKRKRLVEPETPNKEMSGDFKKWEEKIGPAYSKSIPFCIYNEEWVKQLRQLGPHGCVQHSLLCQDVVELMKDVNDIILEDNCELRRDILDEINTVKQWKKSWVGQLNASNSSQKTLHDILSLEEEEDYAIFDDDSLLKDLDGSVIPVNATKTAPLSNTLASPENIKNGINPSLERSMTPNRISLTSPMKNSNKSFIIFSILLLNTIYDSFRQQRKWI